MEIDRAAEGRKRLHLNLKCRLELMQLTPSLTSRNILKDFIKQCTSDAKLLDLSNLASFRMILYDCTISGVYIRPRQGRAILLHLS